MNYHPQFAMLRPRKLATKPTLIDRLKRMAITLYGIKNCDTVKKARKWLEQHHIEHQFHDFRADGLEATKLSGWLKELGSETLINKRSTTWKQLSDAEKEKILAGDALDIALAQPTLIKRPVLETPTGVIVGYSEKSYTEKLN